MAKVIVALKPKYATRKAADKVIFNEGNFLTVIDDATSRRVLSLLDTCHVSYMVDDKYYPIDKDTYEEQFDLIAAEEAPTVKAEEKFGVKKVECFISAPEHDDVIDALQAEEDFKNGVLSGIMYKVANYKEAPDLENVDKNGYWLVLNFDKAGAEAEGYSELKFMGEEEELADGKNFVFMGADEEAVAKKHLTIVGKLTVDEETGDVEQSLKDKMQCKVLNQADAINAIEIDGVAYDSLAEAFVALNGKGGDIYVNKSCVVDAEDKIDLADGKIYNLHLCNGATVSLGRYLAVRGKNTVLNVLGNGTLKEDPYKFAPIVLINTDKNDRVDLYIDKDVILSGGNGLMIDKESYNVYVVCHGTCVAHSVEGEGAKSGIYVYGNVKDCNITFTGSTKGSDDTGIYLAGNGTVTVSGAYVEGTSIGIEQRSGTLNIINSRIIGGTDGEATMIPNGSGTTSSNSALVVAQHNTKNPIYTNVDDASTFIGSAAFYEGNPQQNPEATENTHVVISGGTFAGEIKTMSDADCTKFLYGGHYSSEPDAKYIADGYEAIADINGTFNVVKKA